MIDQATMKPLIWLPLSCSVLLLFSSCANNNQASANDPLGTGPFDANGNYREDWADDPTKWRKPGKRQTPADDLPVIASNELPPATATPLPPTRTSTSKPSSSPSSGTTKPKPVAVKPKPKPKPKPTSTTYTVKKGDSLYTIASRNKTTVSAIQRANGISGSLIRPGQKLKIPLR